jgi:hypothetical protein
MTINFNFEEFSNKKPVFNFFIAFSIFEFALKESGYLIPPRNHNDERVTPYWDKFAQEIENDFNPSKSEVRNAIEYLFTNPPNHQVLVDGHIDWVHSNRPESMSDARWLARIIKFVRNNLFHGGKYPYDPIRDTQLLESSLIVLYALAEMKPEFNDILATAREQLFIQESSDNYVI